MKYRTLGKTGFSVSEISLGAWQIGGKWGEPFDDAVAEKTINAAIDAGVTFIDTADVYDGGKSEKAVARVVKSRSEDVRVATKVGRKFNPHVSESYTPEGVTAFVDANLKNMGVEKLDLVQLHCPPTQVYYRPEIFEALDRLKSAGKILHYGVSVEKVEEALKASEFPGVASVQIIFNIFRQRPAELLFDILKQRDVGVIVRVPLASGLLSGKFTRNSTFGEKDHRTFNRHGEAFDRGETFGGVDYNTGVEAADELKRELAAGEATLAQLALRWILMFDAVSCVIPGASRAEQALDNVRASDLPALSDEQMAAARSVYEKRIKPLVHHTW
ncbi:MAG: aldo/keto reductase [Spirochaetaceae bacterium]|nr:MAG: aldo/keto reductase [Spirochaetaceae bacterium]